MATAEGVPARMESLLKGFSGNAKRRAALYRGKAEEARTIGEAMEHSSSRDIVLEVAAMWGRLADAEERSAGL